MGGKGPADDSQRFGQQGSANLPHMMGQSFLLTNPRESSRIRAAAISLPQMRNVTRALTMEIITSEQIFLEFKERPQKCGSHKSIF